MYMQTLNNCYMIPIDYDFLNICVLTHLKHRTFHDKVLVRTTSVFQICIKSVIIVFAIIAYWLRFPIYLCINSHEAQNCIWLFNHIFVFTGRIWNGLQNCLWWSSNDNTATLKLFKEHNYGRLLVDDTLKIGVAYLHGTAISQLFFAYVSFSFFFWLVKNMYQIKHPTLTLHVSP